MPLSLLEAFASGLPVVSTGVGGVPSILRHGVDGLLVAEDDAASLAAGVIELLGNPALAHRLAESAYRTLSAYEWPVVRDGWLHAYRQAIERTPHRGAAKHAVESTPFNAA
jgi:glycosyltransferase involved in cell wall biosynthesis